MRLKVLEDGSWELAEMRDVEFYFLKQIGKAADAHGAAKAERRLFPDSATEESAEDGDAGSAKEWREFVVPELKDLFRDAVSRVDEDLAGVEIVESEAGDRTFRVRVPAAHADQWYSALNQGRLVLAEKFDLPMSEEEFDEESDVVDERWLAYAQSNIYAFIQSFLLEAVMESPG